MSFNQPGGAGGDTFEPAAYKGALLLIYPKRYNPDEPTKFGSTPSADVDVIVVNDPPEVFRDARLFGNLAKSVRDSIGGVVLGHLDQGPNTKGNPPWILLDYTDDDARAAGPVDEAYQAGKFNQPTAPAAPAASTGAGPAPLNPALKALLESRGINTDGLTDAAAQQIAAMIPQ